MLGVPDGDHGMHLLNQLLLLIIIELHVPLGQARLTCPVLDEDESDLEQAGEKEMREAKDMAQGGHQETCYGRDGEAQARSLFSLSLCPKAASLGPPVHSGHGLWSRFH